MLKPDYAEYFQRKRAELGMEREDVLVGVQTVLDEWYPGLTRAKRLHQGVLRVVTPSASVAGELRMRQLELLERCKLPETRLAIAIADMAS
jgi:Dna[CI] antecedent, DciA